MFYYASILLTSGQITFTQMLQAIFALVFSSMAAGNALAESNNIAKGSEAVQSIFAILDRVSQIDPYSTEGKEPSQVLGDITLDVVDFVYPSRVNAKVLKQFSLKIKRGSVVALVGHSGSGKSSIVGLIERFYDPVAGKIKLDDVDLKDLRVKWLRGQYGFIQQEPMLFDDTVFENIRHGLIGVIGGVDADDVEKVTPMIVQAAKDANAHDFIMKLPSQYQTRCGPRGSLLSGGQIQRIACARAFIRQPKVLILDEATAALDENSQSIVQAAVDAMVQANKITTLIVAHRLSTIKQADIICVVDHGKIAEMGSYDELVAIEGGAFKKLLDAQEHQFA